MKIFKKEEHESVAATLQNIASNYLDLGETEKALEITEKILGASSTIYKNINKIYINIKF